jgi:hypothetical protein
MLQFKPMSHVASKKRRTTVAFGIVCLLLATGPRFVRADHIDEELVKRSPELVKTLHAKGYKNVGVLKFIVKAGKEAPNANIGPLNLVMATRVENALIHGMDPAQPLGVLRDATKVAAAANPKFTTQTDAGRAALLKLTYPLAWGSDKVSPDALLSGLVTLSRDMKTTTVTIDCFDRTGAKPAQVLKFDVASDRSILAEAGRSYVLKTRSLKATSPKATGKKRSIDELDEDACNSAAATTEGQTVTQQAGAEIPIKFEIRYNDAPQTITQDPGSLGEMRVDEPKAGDTVSFYVTNTTQATIGFVIKVNGESTLNQDTAEDSACQKWIVEAGKTVSLKGFYTAPDYKLTRFKVLSDEDSAARMAEWSGSRPRAGYIDVTVFTPGVADLASADAELSYGRTLRGLSRSLGKQHHPKTAAQARSLVDAHVKSHGSKKKSRGLIVAGDSQEDTNLKEEHLDSTTATFQLQINYYKPAGS